MRKLAFKISNLSVRSVAILELIRNSTPQNLYVNGSPDGPLSNRGSAITGIILRVEILNFVKFKFWPKTYENFLEDQRPF